MQDTLFLRIVTRITLFQKKLKLFLVYDECDHKKIFVFEKRFFFLQMNVKYYIYHVMFGFGSPTHRHSKVIFPPSSL